MSVSLPSPVLVVSRAEPGDSLALVRVLRLALILLKRLSCARYYIDGGHRTCGGPGGVAAGQCRVLLHVQAPEEVADSFCHARFQPCDRRRGDGPPAERERQRGDTPPAVSTLLASILEKMRILLCVQYVHAYVRCKLACVV